MERPEACKLPAVPEEVGHAYGPARNSVSRMVSKHYKINVETALEVRFCTCPVARTRSCRSTILGSRIVEMGLYCSCVSVALGSHNFAGPAAKVRPVRPWPYRFLREKKWRHLDSNLRVRYGVASPSSSP